MACQLFLMCAVALTGSWLFTRCDKGRRKFDTFSGCLDRKITSRMEIRVHNTDETTLLVVPRFLESRSFLVLSPMDSYTLYRTHTKISIGPSFSSCSRAFVKTNRNKRKYVQLTWCVTHYFSFINCWFSPTHLPGTCTPPPPRSTFARITRTLILESRLPRTAQLGSDSPLRGITFTVTND